MLVYRSVRMKKSPKGENGFYEPKCYGFLLVGKIGSTPNYQSPTWCQNISKKIERLEHTPQNWPTSCLWRGNANSFIFGFGDIFLEYVPEVCWNVLSHSVECWLCISHGFEICVIKSLLVIAFSEFPNWLKYLHMSHDWKPGICLSFNKYVPI